jgi:hypothetical protein
MNDERLLHFLGRFLKGEPHECWPWLGKLSNGYGYFWTGAHVQPAHRTSYEHFVGPIPEGLHIDHLCRDRSCINPDHLEAVTPQENLRRGDHVHRNKTHCKHGHELTEDNVYRQPGKNHRYCRSCRQRRRREITLRAAA